jgi:hypothetical protein
MSSEFEDLKKAARERGNVEPPSVEIIEPEVRTGTQYAIAGAPAIELKGSTDDAYNLGAGNHSMTIWGFDAVLGREEEFHKWLRENEPKLADACPEGVHYLGTYTADARAPRGTGGYRTFWSEDGFDAMDRFGAEAGDPRSPFGRLLREFGEFRDDDRLAGRSELFVQRAALVAKY